jgi:hypothetical protein
MQITLTPEARSYIRKNGSEVTLTILSVES